MKIELDLTEEQYLLLIDLVFTKFKDLTTEEDNLLVVRDFSLDEDRFEKYQKKIDELKEPIKSLSDLYDSLFDLAGEFS